jgi:hypothetical protein
VATAHGKVLIEGGELLRGVAFGDSLHWGGSRLVGEWKNAIDC